MSRRPKFAARPLVREYRDRAVSFVPWRRALSYGKALLVFAVVFALGRSSITWSDPAPSVASSNPTSAVTVPVSVGSGPRTVQDGMPAGFPDTEAGARTAGIAFASGAEQQMLYFDDPAIERAQREISVASRFDQLLADRRRMVDQWRNSLASGDGQLWWVVTPLASRQDAYTPDRARVMVWVSFVVSRAPSTLPRAWFGVQTVDLVWERGDWRVWSESLEPGPTPQLAAAVVPTPASDLTDRLAGFELVKAEP